MPKKDADTFDGPFEVMVDTIGYPPNEHKRGDLLNRSDTPYDLDELESRGSVRRAQEYADSGLESATQPVDAQGRVDEDVQRSARAGAGVQEADKPAAKGK